MSSLSVLLCGIGFVMAAGTIQHSARQRQLLFATLPEYPPPGGKTDANALPPPPDEVNKCFIFIENQDDCPRAGNDYISIWFEDSFAPPGTTITNPAECDNRRSAWEWYCNGDQTGAIETLHFHYLQPSPPPSSPPPPSPSPPPPVVERNNQGAIINFGGR
mmetsp:Transcript_59571/g.98792  ORF Transcript_59571/g.98792 Transcript_59571/m.98792 type:complete len:161 (-) Transcript_59571:809-1291(-)